MGLKPIKSFTESEQCMVLWMSDEKVFSQRNINNKLSYNNLFLLVHFNYIGCGSLVMLFT